MRLEQFIDRLEIFVDHLPENAQRIVQEESDAAVTRMREDHFQPYPGGEKPWLARQGNRLFRRSGQTKFRRSAPMEDSLKVVVKGSPSQITARFSMTGPGAQTQEYGRAFSVRTGFMRFQTGPKWYRRRTVHNPGRPVVGPEVQTAAARIVERFRSLEVV